MCMLSSGHPCQCSEFLSLSSCAENKDPFVRHIIHIIIEFADHPFRYVDISELLADLDIVDHGSS